MTNSASNKRIAKNTFFLYVRMLLTMTVSLYTSRVILQALGFEDYGLYNVVGSVVAMFTFISAAMANSTQRFITIELGKGITGKLNIAFSTSIYIHVIIGIIILILAETIGLWFLYNKLVIPEDRFYAVFCVFQISTISCMISLIKVPYNMLIIAHERMSIFAFLSIIDVLLKLLIVYVIQVLPYDRLIMYAFLLFVILVIDCSFYIIYCVRNFTESRKIRFQKNILFKEMFSFAGWSLIGNLAHVGYTQGLNILLNMFFGPAVNAARGIAVQVQNAVKSFIANFQIAVSPQITKSYANGDLERLKNLIFTSSRMSFYLMLCLSLPIFWEADYLLSLWLKEVPDHTVVFLKIILLCSLIEPLSNPLGVANNATGKIRRYQIIEGTLLLLIIPISYIFLRWGYSANIVFIIQLIISIIVQLIRVILVYKKLTFSILEYSKNVLLRICLVFTPSFFLSAILYNFLHITNRFLHATCFSILCICLVLFCAYLLGIEDNEKIIIRQKSKMIINKIKI